MTQYHELFKAAGATPPDELERLLTVYQRVERLTQGGHLAAIGEQLAEFDPAKVTQAVKEAARRDAEAELIAERWSRSVPRGWDTREVGWAPDLLDEMRKVFLTNAGSLIEARRDEFGEAAAKLSAILGIIGENPDAETVLATGTPEKIEAYQGRLPTLRQLAAIHEWREEFMLEGYGEDTKARNETVAWYLDPDDPQSEADLDLAHEIWANTEAGREWEALLARGFVLRLNTATEAGALMTAWETAKGQSQQTEQPKILTVDEINQRMVGEKEVLVRSYGSWSDVPQEEKRKLAEWKREQLDLEEQHRNSNKWAATYA